MLQQNREQMSAPAAGQATGRSARSSPAAPVLATYAPGHEPAGAPPGHGIRCEPGGVIELQMHYTTNGEAATDRTKVGLQFFAKDPSPRKSA